MCKLITNTKQQSKSSKQSIKHKHTGSSPQQTIEPTRRTNSTTPNAPLNSGIAQPASKQALSHSSSAKHCLHGLATPMQSKVRWYVRAQTIAVPNSSLYQNHKRFLCSIVNLTVSRNTRIKETNINRSTIAQSCGSDQVPRLPDVANV